MFALKIVAEIVKRVYQKFRLNRRELSIDYAWIKKGPKTVLILNFTSWDGYFMSKKSILIKHSIFVSDVENSVIVFVDIF